MICLPWWLLGLAVLVPLVLGFIIAVAVINSACLEALYRWI